MTHNTTKHNFSLTRANKEKTHETPGRVIWLTGLSGSGKSTIANELEKLAFSDNKVVKTLDGDNFRLKLCKDLGFSQEDRLENLRRVSEVAKLFVENGTLTICSFISPLISQREMIKEILADDLILIHIDTDLETCKSRDPKGLYKKAIKGEIKDFTGVSSPYETPNNPNLTINTTTMSAEEAAQKIYIYYLETIK